MTTTGKEHWQVWYDVENDRGDIDAEMKEFRTYKAAVAFAKRHANDMRPAEIDHFDANGNLI